VHRRVKVLIVKLSEFILLVRFCLFYKFGKEALICLLSNCAPTKIMLTHILEVHVWIRFLLYCFLVRR